MSLNLKDFPTIVRDSVTAIQNSSTRLLDLTIGSILRAVVESTAATGLWLQGLVIALLATTRAATAVGADLDSWVADYSMSPRLAASAATGSVTFARFTAAYTALIPIGSLLKTGDSSQSFFVTIDATNAAYSAPLGGYVLAAGVSSVTAPVAAVAGGSGGNVGIGQITSIAQPITYVDTVTNAAAFLSGVDAETDVALRARFAAYIASLSKATKAAISYAISSAYPAASFSLTENVQYGGTTDYGYFYVVVDDGTGTPSGVFLAAIANAVDLVRPFTSRFGVFGPALLTAAVTMTATIAAGYDPVATKLAIKVAVQNYISALGLGGDIYYTRLLQVAYDASPGVVNISGLTVAGGTADMMASAQQIIKPGVIVIN